MTKKTKEHHITDEHRIEGKPFHGFMDEITRIMDTEEPAPIKIILEGKMVDEIGANHAEWDQLMPHVVRKSAKAWAYVKNVVRNGKNSFWLDQAGISELAGGIWEERDQDGAKE